MGRLFDPQFANVADYDCFSQVVFEDIEDYVKSKKMPSIWRGREGIMRKLQIRKGVGMCVFNSLLFVGGLRVCESELVQREGRFWCTVDVDGEVGVDVWESG